jgi:DUF4097 and DUF4098 domain-containing protein YvlB
MKAKEIILAILIIAVGAFIYYAQSGRLDWEFHNEVGPFFTNWDEFTYEETLEVQAPLPQQLQVINAHGQVEIQGTDGDKVMVSFKKRIWRKNETEAKKVADQLKMIMNREDPKLVLSTNRDEFRQKRFETDFKISVPAGMNVLVRNSYGLVKTEKTGKTDITNPHGNVDVSEAGGDLSLENSYADVEVRGVQGGCRITGPHSSLTVSNIQGELMIDHSYGEIRLENIEKGVTIDGTHSTVSGKGLKGSAEIQSSYEKITLVDVGPAKIRAHHCDVEIDGAKGLVDITDNYGRLQISNLQGNLKVEGPNLEIFANGINAEDIWISSSNENIELLGFAGKATVLLNHGDVALEPDSITGPMEVQASYSNIRLAWPKGGRYPFEAETRSGDITWGLAEKPSTEKTNGTSMTKAFLEESGKPSIKLSTTYGDIRVAESTRALKTI